MDVVQQILEKTTGLKWASEFKFHPKRRWRFDYACEVAKVAIEINGGNYVRGRHSNPTALAKEYQKFAEANAMGWVVVSCTPMTNKNEVMRFGTEMFWDVLLRILKRNLIDIDL